MDRWMAGGRTDGRTDGWRMVEERTHTMPPFAVGSSASSNTYTSYASLGAALGRINTAVGPIQSGEMRQTGYSLLLGGVLFEAHSAPPHRNPCRVGRWSA